MPLLGKKVFQLAKPLTTINPEETVYVIKHTNECFQSKDEYDKRIKLYKEKVWTCQCTGHVNLTHEEAWKSEQDAHQMLKKTFPECMEKPVLEIVHHSTLSLDALIDQAYVRVNSVFFLGDQVQFKVKHGGRVIRGRISKIGNSKMESSCHSPCSDKENSKQTSTNNNDISSRKYPPKLLPYNYNVRLLDEDKIISSVPAEDLIRCERPPNKDLIRLFIRAHALRSGTSANSPWVVDPKLVKKYSLPSKFADFLLSYPRLSEEVKTNCLKKRRRIESSNFLPKKKLKVELRVVPSETALHHYLKTMNSSSVGLKKENVEVLSPSSKDKVVSKQDETTSDYVLSAKTVTTNKEPQTFSSLDHSYSSPVKKQVGSHCSEKVIKTSFASVKNHNSSSGQQLKNQRMKVAADKQTPKTKNKNTNEQGEREKSSTGIKLKKKVQDKKGNQSNPKKQKLKQITLFDLSAKKNKKTSLKTRSNTTPIKKPPEEASKPLTKSPIKPPAITPAKLDLLVKKINSKIKEKNRRNINIYIDRLIKHMNPQQYSELPDDTRIFVLRRIAWTEEKLKLAKMNEVERETYLKQKQLMKLKEKKEEKMKRETVDTKENENKRKLKVEDQLMSLQPLPQAKLVPTPDGVPNELFGDAVMVVEFIDCYSGLLMPGEPYPVQTDLLLKSIASGRFGFGYLSRILLILLQTLLQDQIAEDYSELGVRLSDLPVNIYTSSELVRLCLRKHDDITTSNTDEEEENEDVPDNILSLLETAEIYDLLPEEKLKILCGLCHRVMNSYSVQEYMEQKQKMASDVWKQRILEIKKVNDEKGASETKTKDDNESEVNAKQEQLLDNGKEISSNETEADDTEKDLPLGNDGKPEDLISVLKRRRILAKKAIEEKEKKLQEDREQRMKDTEKMKKQKQKDRFEKKYEGAITAAKLALRQTHLGYDRNHSRYWLFCEGTPGLYLEKGWIGENIEYRVECKEDPFMSPGQDGRKSYGLTVTSDEADNESSIPRSGQNLWFHYDHIRQVDHLIKSLSIRGTRESHLRKKLQKHYDEIVQSMNFKKKPHVEMKSSDGDQQILEAFKKELTETEVRVRSGLLGGVPNFDQWNDRLQKATSIKDLIPCLLETQANVLPRFLQGIMRIKNITLESNNEDDGSNNPRSKQFQHWLDSVEMCATMSRLHVLLGVLDACIKWDKSSANAKCKICRKKNEDLILILCDNCDQAFHVYCLRPALTEVPDGDWICPACQPLSSRQNNRVETLQRRHQEEMKGSSLQPQGRSKQQERHSFEDSCHTTDEEITEDDTLMEECCLCGGDEDVIHCTQCRMGFHTFCHQPPMHNKPRGQWICNYCQTGQKNRSIEKMRKKWQPWKIQSSRRKTTRAEKPLDNKSASTKTEASSQMTTRYRSKMQSIQKKPVDGREIRALRRAATRSE